MCLYEANEMKCGCSYWSKLLRHCRKDKQTCGRKFVGRSRHLDCRCKICQKIWIKKDSIRKKETQIWKWREESEKQQTDNTSQTLVEKDKLSNGEEFEDQVEKSGNDQWEKETLRGEETRSEDSDSLRKGSMREQRRSKLQLMLSHLSRPRCDPVHLTTARPVEKEVFGTVLVNHASSSPHTLEPLVIRHLGDREASIKKAEGEIFFLRRDIEALLAARDEKREAVEKSLGVNHVYQTGLKPLPLVKRKMEPRDEWVGRESIGTLNLDPVLTTAYNPKALVSLDDRYFLAAAEQADNEAHTRYLFQEDQETSRAARLSPELARQKARDFCSGL